MFFFMSLYFFHLFGVKVVFGINEEFYNGFGW